MVRIMIPERLVPIGLVWALLLAAVSCARGGEATPAKSKTAAKSTRATRTPRTREAEPPPCTHHHRIVQVRRVQRPPARTMPELFARMGESFMRDPARGFQNFIEELSQLEGPALQGVTISAAEERQAGRKARDEFLRRAAARGYRLDNDRDKLAYLRELVDGFARRMRHRARYPNIEVSLIDAPIPDGQSFPGGFLVFTTGLLDEPDEATVAGVVAHELAHLDRGHLYEYARRGKLAEATYSRPPGMMGGPDFDRFFTRQMALFGLMMNPFRPEHESEADCTSVTWLYQEGYDPKALVSFFERMHARNRDQPDNPFFSFGRTHPYSLDRRRDVLVRLDQLQRWRPRRDLGRYPENLRRKVSRFRERAEP
ncbi:MAG: M48 family metallopeptidase [Isosphaeraceae bacterium]|nr:M48 family metallopeptidase [Isosphaeraceae bacterium]